MYYRATLSSNSALVEHLIGENILKTPEVIETLKKIDRGHFT